MAITVTHSFFAKDVYDVLPSTVSKKLDVNRLKMFAQGTDGFDFYRHFLFFSNKKMRNFYKYFHTHKTKEYFLNLLEYIKKNKINDKDVYSYLVGFITHFALETTLNPYIIYKTGIFNKNKYTTYKYNNSYMFMEHFLDNDMIKRRTKQNPYRFPIRKYCFDLYPFSNNLKDTINYSFKKTYNQENMSRKYYKSLRKMRRRISLFRKDRFGIKKFIYTLIDTFTPKRVFRFEALSYHYPLEDKHNYLNSNHSLWRNPTTYDMTSKDSFVDLYLKSLKLAKKLTTSSFDYLAGKDISLDKVYKNLNYFTGINCKSKKELKYFEF